MIGDISQPLMGSGEKEGGVGVCLWKSRHGRAVGRRATPRVAILSNGKAYLGGQLALMHGYEGCESLSFTFSFPRFRLRVSVVPSRFQCLEAEKDVLGLMMMALSWRDLREQGECEDTLFIVMIFGVRTPRPAISTITCIFGEEFTPPEPSVWLPPWGATCKRH